MLKLLIIDDEMPARKELCYLIQSSTGLNQVWEAKNGQEALEVVANQSVDAAFVDIELGDIDGISLAKELLELQPDLKIIFATAYDEYAIKAFELNALDYVLKPFEQNRIQMALLRIQNNEMVTSDLAANNINQINSKMRKLSLWNGDRIILIELDQIVFITTSERSCEIYTFNATYSSSQPLGYFEQKFKGDKFLRANRSYLVNLEHIMEILPWFNHSYRLKMRQYEQEEILISRNRIKEFRQVLGF